jgi:hypothetical protein
MDDHFEQQSRRIHKQMPFATGEFFGSILAIWPTSLGGLDGLTINDGGTWDRLASFLHPEVLAEGRHNAFLQSFIQSFIAKDAEVVIDS